MPISPQQFDTNIRDAVKAQVDPIVEQIDKRLKNPLTSNGGANRKVIGNVEEIKLIGISGNPGTEALVEINRLYVEAGWIRVHLERDLGARSGDSPDWSATLSRKVQNF